MSRRGKGRIAAAVVFSVVAPFLHGAANAGNPEAGEAVYSRVCANCHGRDGVTDVPGMPVFANGDRPDKTDDQLKMSIMRGVNNPDNPAAMSMPPYGGGPALTDKELSDVISYIRTLRK